MWNGNEEQTEHPHIIKPSGTNSVNKEATTSGVAREARWWGFQLEQVKGMVPGEGEIMGYFTPDLWVLGVPWSVFKRWRGWAMRSEKVMDRVMWEIRHYFEDLGFLRWLTYTGDIVNSRQRVVSKLWRLEGRAAESSCKEGADFHIWGSVFDL